MTYQTLSTVVNYMAGRLFTFWNYIGTFSLSKCYLKLLGNIKLFNSNIFGELIFNDMDLIAAYISSCISIYYQICFLIILKKHFAYLVI